MENKNFAMEEIKMDSRGSRSMREFFKRTNCEENIEYLWRPENDHMRRMPQQSNTVLVEIEVIYGDGNREVDTSVDGDRSTFNINGERTKTNKLDKTDMNYKKFTECSSLPFNTLKHSARVYLSHSNVAGTFIEEELKKGEGVDKNYMKIELKAKKNKIMLESILDCLEYLVDRKFEFHYNKDNLISYFYAFSLCKLVDKRKEVLDRLLLDLSDDNIIYFLKVVANLDDDFLSSYSFWLLRYLINKNVKGDKITFNGYDYESIVKLSPGVKIKFDSNRIIIHSNKSGINASANLLFLNNYFESNYRREFDKYFNMNNHFNMGRVLRRKSDDNFVDDYPHYYQLLLENEPSIVLFAIRQSENSNFIISKSYDDFSKYGENYVAEIVPNFWGTFFDIYDFGYEKSLHESTPRVLSKPRESIGSVQYETNIMGECPRYFSLSVKDEKGQLHKMENLKPEWNEDMDCYCLNFYGRVKKASAKNFQIVYPDDPDNIILQHGKVSSDEYNIDFREPLNFVFAFAVSLVAIGKKRVVS